MDLRLGHRSRGTERIALQRILSISYLLVQSYVLASLDLELQMRQECRTEDFAVGIRSFQIALVAQ